MTAADGELVWRLAQGPDADNPYSRTFAPGAGAAPWLPGPFRFGVPHPSQLEFFGDEEAALPVRGTAHRATRSGRRRQGDHRLRRHFATPPVCSTRAPGSPNGSPRSATSSTRIPDEVNPDRGIHHPGRCRDAAPPMPTHAAYRLKELERRAAHEWAQMDLLLLPTTGTIYTLAEDRGRSHRG